MASAGVPSRTYGPRVQATVALCTGAYRLSKRTTQLVMDEVFGVSLSVGTISPFWYPVRWRHRDILKWREALWTFVQVEGVEPTNNTAERSIRLGVLWRQGSFGTQSAEGARFVESMMTVVATLKQQQRHVL